MSDDHARYRPDADDEDDDSSAPAPDRSRSKPNVGEYRHEPAGDATDTAAPGPSRVSDDASSDTATSSPRTDGSDRYAPPDGAGDRGGGPQTNGQGSVDDQSNPGEAPPQHHEGQGGAPRGGYGQPQGGAPQQPPQGQGQPPQGQPGYQQQPQGQDQPPQGQPPQAQGQPQGAVQGQGQPGQPYGWAQQPQGMQGQGAMGQGAKGAGQADPFAAQQSADSVQGTVSRALSDGGVRGTLRNALLVYGLLGVGFGIVGLALGGFDFIVFESVWNDGVELVDPGVLLGMLPAVALVLALFTGVYAGLRHGGSSWGDGSDAVVAGAAGAGLGTVALLLVAIAGTAVPLGNMTLRIDNLLWNLLALVGVAALLGGLTPAVLGRFGVVTASPTTPADGDADADAAD
jgi:hypothetical protein